MACVQAMGGRSGHYCHFGRRCDRLLPRDASRAQVPAPGHQVPGGTASAKPLWRSGPGIFCRRNDRGAYRTALQHPWPPRHLPHVGDALQGHTALGAGDCQGARGGRHREGSVIREGNQIRVHAQLIRGATDEHIWAEEYQREYRSLLALQEEVARSIAERIEISLTPQEQASLGSTHPVDPEAHEDYLNGRYYFNQQTAHAVTKSIGFFQQAIASNPSYALAYSGLADAYAMRGFRGGIPQKDALSRAKAAALKAI